MYNYHKGYKYGLRLTKKQKQTLLDHELKDIKVLVPSETILSLVSKGLMKGFDFGS